MGRNLQKTNQIFHQVPNTLFFNLHCLVLAKFLCCWVLSLVDVDIKMHIKIIRKSLLCFHGRLTWILLCFKSDRFSISLSLSVKNSFQRAWPMTNILYFDPHLIQTLDLHNLVSKNYLGTDVLTFEILVEILLVQFQSQLYA